MATGREYAGRRYGRGVKVLVFGATGMVGQGVVRECLLAADVESVVAVGRSSAGVSDPKLREVRRPDLFDLAGVAELSGVDACFFCLGVPSSGMSEADYTRVTHDLTLYVASVLDPSAVFVYVSGQGADRTEKGRVMWARVRGRTENALLDGPLDAYILRPGYIQPRHGARSKVALYRTMYRVTSVLYPLLRLVLRDHITTTETVGRAMLALARGGGADTRVLNSPEMNALAR
ncbi:NAD-dependent epimerase/dehydratase family protein [Actinophytocola sp.]|uniref:NAD-dependent epimerase/dehydratase family protein n=1 Tax=Actinophytocola sp. TaxID=1872138 RepID=UPI0025C57ADE|nr:NAD-dependent epimerase/dehydratase family protein [Actinophytocola sp.]